MNDRLLRITAVLSVLVLVGVAVAVGGAAAQENFEVEDLDAPYVSPHGVDDPISITATINNTGSSAGTQTIEYRTTNGDDPNGAVSNVEDTATVNSLAPGDTTQVSFSVNTVNLDGANPSAAVDYTQGVFSQNASANQTLTVGTNSSGVVTIEVQDDTLSNVGDVGVDLYRSDTFNSISNPGPRIRTGDTSTQQSSFGRVQFTGLAVGENSSLSEDYTAVAAQDEPEFSSGTTQLNLYEPDQTEDNARITIERNTLPDEFDITQSAESAIADGEDTITFNVSIIGDLDGQRLTDEEFTVFHDGGDAVSIASGTQFTTGSNGFVEFEVSSNASQRVEFEFVAERLDRERNEVVELREKNFILQGEGYVIGDVWDVGYPEPTEHSLPDARVWAVQKDTFGQNAIAVPTTGYNNSGQDSFYRVWRTEDPANFTQSDPEVDELLDVTQDYRIDNDGQNNNLSISRVRELDTNDSSAGNGFAVRANVNNPDPMYVTPLEPGFYYIEHSDNAPNASDQRFADATPPRNFNSIGGVGASGGDLSVELTTDLTFEATQQFSSFSGQKLWDITDENGEYVLDRMYTDFQAGVDYTVIANKAGYEIEFIDPLVTENGAFFEDGGDENFGLRQIEEDIEVNVTNIAALPSQDDAPEDAANPDAYDEFEFEDKTDEFSQEVPRDGRTIDVIQVNTQTESGAPVDEEIELSIPTAGPSPGTPSNDLNFTGEFVAVAGGTVVSENPDEPTITISTGSDGEAIVWLQSDLDDQDLASVSLFGDDAPNTGGLVCETGEFGESEFFSGIVAQSPTDAGVVDATCKDFAGTAVLRTAELSGVVTNQDNDPVESRVWLNEIDLNAPAPNNPNPNYFNTNHRIEITRNGANDYDVRQVYDNFTTLTSPSTLVDTVVIGQETGLSANNLRNYEGFGTTNFPQIAVAGDGEGGFTLLTDSDDVDDPVSEDSTYTLPEVPAESAASPVTGVTPTGIDRATFSFRGSAVETGVQVGRTSTANIEITTPTGAEFNVTDVAAPETVNQGDTFDVEANVTNEGVATSEQDVDYELVDDETGTVVASDTVSLTLSGAETQTVTFEDIDTTGLDAGNYTNVVTTVDDTTGEEAPTEIVTDGSGGNGDSPIDGVSDELWDAVTQGDGELSLGDLGTAISEYQDDGEIDGVEIELADLGSLISYYQSEVA
ncbi:MAG: hypothetical protein U5J64_04400 [Halobacteriales archaeon]|nr:hypothetical protein [Halobacteriales archaeon]